MYKKSHFLMPKKFKCFVKITNRISGMRFENLISKIRISSLIRIGTGSHDFHYPKKWIFGSRSL